MNMQRNPERAHTAADVEGLEEAVGGFSAHVEAQLEAAGRANSVAGRNALLMARCLDARRANASGLASLNREFWRVYQLAMSGIQQMPPDAVDEIARRRDAKRRRPTAGPSHPMEGVADE